MNDINILLKKYKYNKELSIEYINRQDKKVNKCFNVKDIGKYSNNCTFISLGNAIELYIDDYTNNLILRRRIGETINNISKRILEFNYNE